MNRKLALALSVSASVVLVSAAGMLATVLSQPPDEWPAPEMASLPEGQQPTTTLPLEPTVVVVDEVEFVPSGDTQPAEGSSAIETAPTASGSGSGPGGEVTGGAVAAPRPADAPPTEAPTVTTAPSPATTTTSRPPGVPEDWPAGKPIPPMPVGCRQPQLEDDGVWNCQH